MNDNEGVNKSFDSVGNEKLINEFSGLRSNIDKNTEAIVSELKTVQKKLEEIDEGVKSMVYNEPQESQSITIAHFAIGIFCICVVIVLF